jgi:hypothetical protein
MPTPPLRMERLCPSVLKPRLKLELEASAWPILFFWRSAAGRSSPSPFSPLR